MPFTVGADLFPWLAGTLAAVSCGLLGNFLVLRRLSLMGDAISHSVLPGLVVAFIVTQSRSPAAMIAGAGVAGAVTVGLVELVKRLGRVEPGAAMGVVFSVLFALGVLLIGRLEGVESVDLDADCVLHGNLETLVWWGGAPQSLVGVLHPATLAAVPRQVWTLAATAVVAGVFVAVFFKELRIAAFDPDLATTQGYSAGVMHTLLMLVVAAATVASFEAVGSILVIAMLVCPAAAARLLTDRLVPQIAWSLAVALACGTGGYAAATLVPAQFGAEPVSAAGSMAVAGGVLLAGAAVLSPRHGVLAGVLRRHVMAAGVAREDLLATLFRAAERGEPAAAVRPRALAPARRRGLVEMGVDGPRLTDAGRVAAAEIVRRHRLWETYLVENAGVAPDHVHETAERLEHLAPRPPEGPAIDPHGRTIPDAGAPWPGAPKNG